MGVSCSVFLQPLIAYEAKYHWRKITHLLWQEQLNCQFLNVTFISRFLSFTLSYVYDFAIETIKLQRMKFLSFTINGLILNQCLNLAFSLATCHQVMFMICCWTEYSKLLLFSNEHH